MSDKYGRNACVCGFVPPTHTHADDCPVMHPPLRPSDSLRDRIAAVIDDHAPIAAKDTGEVVWCRCTGPSDVPMGWAAWRDHVADAVIAELQVGLFVDQPDWKADDERP